MSDAIPADFDAEGLDASFDAPYPVYACLLYTSDAADDLLCVDLGGRRIIKKKNTQTHRRITATTTTHKTRRK